jgi:hypothetical protein
MKKSIVGVLFGVVFVLAAGLVLLNTSNRPLKTLNAADVASIEIASYPPNEAKVIDKAVDIEKIVGCLKKAVVTNQVKQNGYNGLNYICTLTFKDASRREIVISNPIVSIDGVFYNTSYSPSEKLDALYKQLDYTVIKK